jgi:hypothetical protein
MMMALAADVRQFFSRPIPRLVWESVKELQDNEFVEFVQSCLEEGVSDQKSR